MTKRREQIIAQSTGLMTSKFVSLIYSVEYCYYCKQATAEDRRTMDHKIPVSKGGLHDPQNIVMACLSCNSSKQDLTESEFVEKCDGEI